MSEKAKVDKLQKVLIFSSSEETDEELSSISAAKAPKRKPGRPKLNLIIKKSKDDVDDEVDVTKQDVEERRQVIFLYSLA